MLHRHKWLVAIWFSISVHSLKTGDPIYQHYYSPYLSQKSKYSYCNKFNSKKLLSLNIYKSWYWCLRTSITQAQIQICVLALLTWTALLQGSQERDICIVSSHTLLCKIRSFTPWGTHYVMCTHLSKYSTVFNESNRV